MAEQVVSVITGAGSGIGRATAYRMAAEGHRLILVDLNEAELAATAAVSCERGALSVSTVIADVSDASDVARVFGAADLAPGALWLVANVAGVGVRADTPTTTLDEWQHVLNVNLTGAFLMCREALPRMLAAGRGCIVNVGSVAGLVGIRERAAYCASKGGVIALTRAIAADHAAAGIRANVICPGTVETEWIGRILAGSDDPGSARAAMHARQLDGRMGTADEVAAGIAFLASDDGRFMNGSAFVMDGGLTAV